MNSRAALAVVFGAVVSAGCAVPGPVDARGKIVIEANDSRFDSYLRDMAEKEHFSGVVLVMREGKLLQASGYGAATRDLANGIDTKFHVGSITKQFTAAAVLQLVERGAVRLDAPINRYLPERYRSAKWDGVTVHHLLSHTSGIPDYALTRDYYRVVNGFCSDGTVDGMLKEAGSKDLEFAPGSRFSYTNLGYTLLGVVIENQTKTSFGEYLKRNIFTPLGMTSSHMHDFGSAPVAGEAEGFRWSAEQRRQVPDEVVSLPATAPDGGLITTLGDFVEWTRVLAGGEPSILNQESIARMSSPHIVIGNGGPLDSMGYGLYVGDRLIGHGGLVVGFSSQFVMDRETRSLIVVFSNDFGADPQRVAFGLLTILMRSPAAG